MKETEWMDTTWKGHAYPPFFVVHFQHQARVRVHPETGEIEAEFYDDDPRSRLFPPKQWHRMVNRATVEMLYDQALQERQ